MTVRPALFLLATLGIGCGGAESGKPPAAAKAAPLAFDVERYFPLEEGRIYHYVTREGGETGMLVARVHRTDAAHAELRLSNKTQRFALSAEGVRYVDGAFVLKGPLAVGTSWPGEHGGTTKIVADHATITVPAGSYTECIETSEEGGRVPNARYVVTYCPGIGMVRLSVTLGPAEGVAELKSYGFPVKID